MNVYVESNFVLELALAQEQFESCEGILSLCEAGNVRLVVPAYSLDPTRPLRGGKGNAIEGIRARIIEAACVIPLDVAVLASATQHQRAHDFSAQDALVY